MMTASVKSRYQHLLDGVSAIRGTLILSLVLVFIDVVLCGSYLFSGLVCPIGFLVGLVRAIAGRARSGVAAARVLAPVVTGLLVLANYNLQGEIALANAARIIQACERYREANGAYPERPGDLVPHYLSSVPNAKYCCFDREFGYFYGPPPRPILWWVQVPPFGRRIYNFERGEWHYTD